MEDGSDGVDAQIPISKHASSVQSSPTVMDAAPPPYDASSPAVASEDTEESAEDDAYAQWKRSETTTSVITTTTTTSTTTIAHKPSKSRLKPKVKNKRPRLAKRSSTTRSRSIDSYHSQYPSYRSGQSNNSEQGENDPYLDALLARSVAALELSNSLLQSTIATKSTLSSVLDREEELERQERAWERRLLEGRLGELRDGSLGKRINEQLGLDLSGSGTPSSEPSEPGQGKKKLEWMEEIEGLVRDVESLFDIDSTQANQLEGEGAHGPSGSHPGTQRSIGRGTKRPDGVGLVLGDPSTSNATRSPPPRALTQFVSITGAASGTTLGAGLGKRVAKGLEGDGAGSGAGAGSGGFAAESTADKYSIYLPSTVGDKEGGHKERFISSPKTPFISTGPTGTWKSNRSGQSGHSHLPSTSSTHSASSLTAAIRKRRDEPSLTRRNTPPPTHPEALPLSTQELLQLQMQHEQEQEAPIMSSSPRERLERYLRASTSASTSSTLSRGSAAQVMDLFKGGHAQTPSTSGFVAFSTPQEDSDHARRPSTASSHSYSTHSTKSSLSSFQSGRRSSLHLSPPSPSMGMGSRRSPLLSPTSSTASLGSRGVSPGGGGEMPVDWYSPSLEAHLEEGEEANYHYESSDRERGRRHYRGRSATLSPPSSSRLVPHASRPIPSPSSRTGPTPSSSNRAILGSRFRTADTLRRILDTSPHPSTPSNPSPATSPIDTLNIHSNIISDTDRNTRSRSSTNTSIQSNTNTRSSSNRTNTDSSILTITNSRMATAAVMSPSTPFEGGLSPHAFPESPSGFSSTSDLHSYTSSVILSSDGDRSRTSKLLGTTSSGLRPKVRATPRFMPRTPSGVVAGLSVSGATARAPMMHAHLVVDEAAAAEEAPVSTNDTEPKVVPPQPSPAIEPPASAPIDPPLSSTASSPAATEARRRTKSLSASVSTMLDQARVVEHMKVARVKGGSNLKGSPAWRERRLLDGGSGSGTPGTPEVVESINQNPATPHDGVETPGSKRTSWLGLSGGLIGLGLAINPSGSTGSIAKGGRHSATPSVSGSIRSGLNTPPLRVSFAKEPVKYSEEREREYGRDDLDVPDVDEAPTGEEDAVGADAEDGGLTIKARSIRRVSSWNDSLSAKSSSTRRRVPTKSNSKKEPKKGGWLEWFVNATSAGNSGMNNGLVSGIGGIGREEFHESRGGDWA